jgi:uncharacterized membrane protein
MRLRAARASKVLAVAALGLSPYAVHAALTTEGWTVVAAGLPVLQALIIALLIADRRAAWRKCTVAAVASLILVIVLAQSAEFGLIVASALPHTAAYVVLLAVFSATLRPGRLAFVTALALKVHRSVPDHILAYTRRVTWAWCVFFAGQLLLSALLFAYAPLEIWSLFVNVLNLPLVTAMFVGEYVFRVLRVADSPRHDWRTLRSMFAHLKSDVAGDAKTTWSAI